MAEKILIIDDDLDTLRLVGLMLQKQGYQIVGLLKAEEEIPDLILLDVMMPEMDGYEVARRLRQSQETEGIPILMFTAKSQLDDKVTGFESGADDYLTKPTHPAELHAHVKALLSRSVKTEKKDFLPIEQKAFAVGIVSARGGLGVSSIALNLASYLNSEIGEETIIAEMIPGMGTIGRDLNFSDLNALTYLLENTPEEITKETVEETLFEHDSGLKFLSASEQPKDMVLLNDALLQVATVFSQLRAMTNFLIADFGAGLPPVSQALLPQCDQVIVVVEAFANSIAHSNILLENLVNLGVEKEKIIVVLNNRIRSDMLLSLKQVREEIDYPISVTFTPAPELFFQAAHRNTTAILHQPESMTSQQFQKLATIIIENEAKEK